MNPTQTGIAVALALTIITVFFILPGLSPFGFFGSESAADTTQPTAESTDTTLVAGADQSTTPTTMPITNERIIQLSMKDEVVGTGAVAAAGDTVTVNYVGALTNGTVFDASAKHGTDGFTFTLGVGQVIKGWDQGVAGMREGGKRLLAIPAALAYGAQAVGNVIPADSDLIFEVELLKVQKSAQ